MFELDNTDDWDNQGNEIISCDNSKLIMQLAYFNKIDHLSNAVMRIGSIRGTTSGDRKQANWEDYVLLNGLSEDLKLSVLECNRITSCEMASDCW
jgi:hypothetical protein